MSNKMFEYSLVFEQDIEREMEEISVNEIKDLMKENLEFTRLLGFDVRYEPEFCEGGLMASRPVMLRRIMNDLFSNVTKYGDKGHEVLAELHMGSLTVDISEVLKACVGLHISI